MPPRTSKGPRSPARKAPKGLAGDDVLELFAGEPAGDLVGGEVDRAAVAEGGVAGDVGGDREDAGGGPGGGRSGGGSGSVTSRTARRRLVVTSARRASVSTTAPRAALTRRAPSRIAASSAAPIRPRVSSVSGARTTTASALGSRAGSSSGPWRSSRAREATPTTRAPNGSRKAATWRPIGPQPAIRAGQLSGASGS